MFLMIIFIFGGQSMNQGGAEREGDTESAAGSRLWAVSTEPDTGLELTDREIMTWAEVGRSTEPPRRPFIILLKVGSGGGTEQANEQRCVRSKKIVSYLLWTFIIPPKEFNSRISMTLHSEHMFPQDPLFFYFICG